MIVLAIDPGVEFTGIAVKREGYVSTKTLTAEGFGIERLASMVDEVMSIITFEKPDVVVLEDYGFGGKFFNVEVAELVGTIRYCLWSSGRDCQVVSLAPNTVKKLVAGNGRASKAEVGQAVRKVLTVPVGSDHEADALALLIVMGRFLTESLSAQDLRMIRGRMYRNVPNHGEL